MEEFEEHISVIFNKMTFDLIVVVKLMLLESKLFKLKL